MIDPLITQNLVFTGDGIWTSKEISSVSYPEDAYDSLFSVEDSSFWFQHRNNAISTIIHRFPPKEYILDVGGGNGFVTFGLMRSGFRAILLEPGRQAVINAKRRGINDILHTTFQDAAFCKSSVDSIGLFDVLEHIADDQAFLGSLYNSMKNGARLYITVPAHKFLWSWTDIRAGHFRRYSIRSLTKVLKESCFKIRYVSCFFSCLALPIFITRTLPTILGLKKDISHEKRVKTHRKRKDLLGKAVDKHWENEIKRLRTDMLSHGASIIVVAEPQKS